MSSTFEDDKSGTNGDEARFLAKVMHTLDGSLTQLPNGIEGRLDSARHAVLLQSREWASEGEASSERFSAALELSEQQIPESVRLRLDAIREGAMQRASAAQHKSNGHFGWWKRWTSQGFVVPASAFASICMLVTTLAIFNMSEPAETMPLVVAENSLVLASEEEIELYDNLEFYQWLADNGL